MKRNDTCQRLPSAESLFPLDARVVEWQTRTFEGRMPKGLRVQVPPRAPPPYNERCNARLIKASRGISAPIGFEQHGIALSHRRRGTGVIRLCARDCSFQFLRSLVARTDRECAGEPRQNDRDAAAQGAGRF